jgi:uncharacterized membrane protein
MPILNLLSLEPDMKMNGTILQKKAALIGPAVVFLTTLLFAFIISFIIIRPLANSIARVSPLVQEESLSIRAVGPNDVIKAMFHLEDPVGAVGIQADFGESGDTPPIECSIYDTTSHRLLGKATGTVSGDWLLFDFDTGITAEGGDYSVEFAKTQGARESWQVVFAISPTGEENAAQSTSPYISFYTYPTFLYWYFWIIALPVCALLALLWHMAFTRKSKPEALFLVAAIALGVFHMFVTTPYGVHDEGRTTKTIEYYSSVLLGADQSKDELSGEVTWENRAVDTFDGLYEYPATAPYYHVWNHLFEFADKPHQTTEEHSKIYGGALQLVPQILGVTFARILHLGQVPTLYMGKLFSLAFYILLLYFAVRLAPGKSKLLFAIIGLGPQILDKAGTLSYDTAANAVCLFFIALVLHLSFSQSKVTLKSGALLFGAGVLLTPLKLVYAPLLLLTLMIPSDKWKSSQTRVLYCMALALAGAASLLFFSGASLFSHVGQTAADSLIDDGSGGIAYSQLWEHKTDVIRLLFHSFPDHLQLISQSVSSFHYRSLPEHLGYLSLFIMILSVSASPEDKGMAFSRKQWALMAFTALSVYLLLLMVCVSWTSPEKYELWGMQGRYFIPILPLIILLFCGLLKRKKLSDGVLLFVTVAINVYALFSVFQQNVFFG